MYDVVTIYFYVAAGATLIILSTINSINKPHRARSRLGGPIKRLIIDFILIIVAIVAVDVNISNSGFKFQASNLLIAIMVIAYAVVIASVIVFHGLLITSSSAMTYLRISTRALAQKSILLTWITHDLHHRLIL